MEQNIILKTDSYKASHAQQYPPNTEYVYSYLESRGSKNPTYTETVFYGLQYILKKHFVGQVVTMEMIDQAESFWNSHFGPKLGTEGADGSCVKFNREGWEYIVNTHGGKLPIRIRAVPEGTVVPLKNVLMTIENTDPKCFWLTNYLETILLQIWYPITVATNSRECKKVIKDYLEQTGDSNLIGFKLHDFGFRGVSSWETSAVGASAHLVNFMGTDTVSGIVLAMNYYNAEMCGFSVPATEHSTMTSWQMDHEVDAYQNTLEIYHDAPIVSIVSDSYNIYSAVEHIYGEQLKDLIMSRPGKLVVRPDSGDPVEVNRLLLHSLWNKFGGHINEKGYKVLDPHVGIIQGDGINLDVIKNILEMMKQEGFSADNMAFGSGGSLLQKFNRDTLKFAIKCSNITIEGESKTVFKNPITAPGKKSKAGHLKLVSIEDTLQTLTSQDTPVDVFNAAEDLLQVVYENGDLVMETDFESVRANASL